MFTVDTASTILGSKDRVSMLVWVAGGGGGVGCHHGVKGPQLCEPGSLALMVDMTFTILGSKEWLSMLGGGRRDGRQCL